MRRLLPTLLAIAMSMILASVAPAQVRNIDDRYYEISGARGRGRSVKEALTDAKRTAVDRAVKVLYTQTEEEWGNYQAARDRILADLDRLVENVHMTDKYRDGQEVVVLVDGNVLRKPLRERLLALGVFKELDTILTGAALPRLAVMVAPESREQDLAVFAAGRINEHMTSRHLALVDDQTLGQLAEADRALVGLPGSGPGSSVAPYADVILILSVRVDHTGNYGDLALYQTSVTIEARIPGTSKAISIEEYRSREMSMMTSGDLDKSRRASVEEAIGGAIQPTMQTVMRFFKEEIAHGRIITFRVKGESARLLALRTILQSKCRVLTASAVPGGEVVTVRYSGHLDDLMTDLAAEPDLDLRVSSESARLLDCSFDP